MLTPRLRKSGILKALALAAAIYAAGSCFNELATAGPLERLEQEFAPKPSEKPPVIKKYEAVRTGSPLNPDACYPLAELTGLKVKTDTIPARFYRNDSVVFSVPEHFIRLYKETGHELRPKREFGGNGADDYTGVQYFKEWMGDAMGGCFFDAWEKDSVSYVIAIPFYRRLEPATASWDAFLPAHEDFHIIQKFGMNEGYRAVKERLKKHGYCIVFSDFDKEEQADIAGILLVNENNLPLDEIFKRNKDAADVYKKMHNYRIKSLYYP